MGMKRMDKGMNRARTVGGTARRGMARSNRTKSRRGDRQTERERQQPASIPRLLTHSFTSELNLSSLFSHDRPTHRPILHSSSLLGSGGGADSGQRREGRPGRAPRRVGDSGSAPTISKAVPFLHFLRDRGGVLSFIVRGRRRPPSSTP